MLERDVIDDLLSRSLRGLLCRAVLDRRRWRGCRAILNERWRRGCRGAHPDARRGYRLGWTVRQRSRGRRKYPRWIRHRTRHLLAQFLLTVLVPHLLALVARVLILADGIVLLLLGFLVHRLHVMRERRRGYRQIRPEGTVCTWRVVPEAFPGSAILTNKYLY